MAKIGFEQVSFRYEAASTPALLSDLDFCIGSSDRGIGKIVGVVGGSGEGKSTLLKLIARLEEPATGRIHVEPRDPRAVGYLPQTPVFLEHLDVRKNANLLSYLGEFKGRFSPETFAKYRDLLGIDDEVLGRKHPRDLSGGEKRRIALLRLIAVRPRILLLDEPCAGLDWAVKGRFLSQLAELVYEEPVLLLYVTHNWSELSPVADEVLFIERRKGAPANVYHQAARVFEGRPPTIKAAKIVHEEPMNFLRVRVSGRDVVCGDSGCALQIGTLGTGLAEGEYFAGFDAIDLHLADGGKYKVILIREGPDASLVRLRTEGKDTDLWVRPRKSSNGFFRLVGAVELFDLTGKRIMGSHFQ